MGEIHTRSLSLVQYQASQVVLLQAHAHPSACMHVSDLSFPLMLFVDVLQHGTPGGGRTGKETEREEQARGNEWVLESLGIFGAEIYTVPQVPT